MNHTTNYYNGNKVWQINNGVHDSFELFTAQLVQQQRQKNRSWKRKNEFIKADEKSILHQSEKIGADNEIHKVLQSNPVAAHDSLGHIKALEGNFKRSSFFFVSTGMIQNSIYI